MDGLATIQPVSEELNRAGCAVRLEFGDPSKDYAVYSSGTGYRIRCTQRSEDDPHHHPGSATRLKSRTNMQIPMPIIIEAPTHRRIA
jgi:hypothetical protein